MKTLLLSLLSRKNTFIFALLIFVTVWFLGPRLSIPLQGPMKRLALIFLFMVGWLIFEFIFLTPSNKSKKTSLPSDLLKKLDVLKGRFEGAIEFLKKTIVTKQGTHISLTTLPWYIMIGSKHAGKTSLLSNANVNFILSKQLKAEKNNTASSAEECDWWVTNGLVVVDVPGNYLDWRIEPTNTSSTSQKIIWDNFLRLIQTRKPSGTLNGIVIAINLPELLKHNTLPEKNITFNIKQRLNELRNVLGSHLPCYFIITKCDLLPGFQEFFGESSIEEQSQLWGITLPSLTQKEKLIPVITHRFNALIKRLNKQLIWRLHQERNPVSRILIKDFPLQVERLKERFISFIKSVNLPNMHINGVFLTSALQPAPSTETNKTFTVHSEEKQYLQIFQPSSAASKPFFIKQLLLQGLLHNPSQAILDKTISWKKHSRLYSGIIGMLALIVVFLGIDFKNSIDQTYKIKTNLSKYQTFIQHNGSDRNSLAIALPLLNTLKKSQDSLQLASFVRKYLAPYSKKTQKNSTLIYTQALQTILVPEIKNTLELYLQSPATKNPTQLYAALESYLMLSDPTHRDIYFLTTTIKQLLPLSLTNKETDELYNHIKNTFLTNNSYNINPAFVDQAREQLANLPRVELAYIILKNMGDNNINDHIKMGTNTSEYNVFINKGLVSDVPKMFTAPGFKNVISGEIPAAATETMDGNWIIGKFPGEEQNADSLTGELQSKYITNYIDIWESQLANLKLATPKNLYELNNILAKLTSNNSPLLEMLETICQNTAFAIITSASPKLNSLNKLLSDADKNEGNYLYQMFVSMRELHHYLQMILQTKNSDAAVFAVQKNHVQQLSADPISRMHTLAQNTPEPMKAWLNQLSSDTQKLISLRSASYIDVSLKKNSANPHHEPDLS